MTASVAQLDNEDDENEAMMELLHTTVVSTTPSAANDDATTTATATTMQSSPHDNGTEIIYSDASTTETKHIPVASPLERTSVLSQSNSDNDDPYESDDEDEDDDLHEEYPLPTTLTPGRRTSSRKVKHPMSPLQQLFALESPSALRLAVPNLAHPPLSSTTSTTASTATTTTTASTARPTLPSEPTPTRSASALPSSHAPSSVRPTLDALERDTRNSATDEIPPTTRKQHRRSTSTVPSTVAPTSTQATPSYQIPQHYLHANASTSVVDRFVSTKESTTAPDVTGHVDHSLPLSALVGLQGVDVPRIVVMGDTSAGKSSVLSQLCGIELPAANVWTTKCPVRLHVPRTLTVQSSPTIDKMVPVRHATIDIEWQPPHPILPNADFPRIVLHQVDATRHQEWRRDVSNAIARAQEFILHHTQHSVSSHVVVVHLHDGPDSMAHHAHAHHAHAPALTLVDLPGLIRSKAGVDECATLAAEIAKVQREYLSTSSRSILVVVQAANVDWHNAPETADALRVDPDTTRTLAVLTKPDLIDKGAEADVVQLLQGQHLAFALGWHMVKCRGQAALDAHQSMDEALVEERQYFDTVEPWKSVTDRTLLGTVQLRQKLGDLLASLMRSTVPSLLAELRERHATATTRLAAMNETGSLLATASDRRRYFQTTCRGVVARIAASLTGKGSSANGTATSTSGTCPNRKTAAARLHEDCAHFCHDILQGSLATIRTAVEGSAVLVTTPRGLVVRGEMAHLTDTFACVDYVDSKDRHSNVLFEATGVKGTHVCDENDLWTEGGKILLGRAQNKYDVLQQIPLSRIRTDPTWLKEKIAHHRTDDLACFLNIDIFKNVIEEFITVDWQPHAVRLLDQTRDTMYAAVEDVVNHGADENGMPSKRYPRLATLIGQQCRAAAKSLLLDAQRQIAAHFEMERHPYTQNKDLFEMIAKSKHATLRRELEVALKVDSDGVFDTQAIKALMDSVFERQQQKSMEDQMAEEMEIVLDAYGSVAAQRVVDRTPMVCWEVFRLLPNAIHEALGNVTDETLDRHMQENPRFQSQHQALTDELANLNRAMEHFESMV